MGPRPRDDRPAEWQDNGGVANCAQSRDWCAEGWDIFTNNSLSDPDATPQRTVAGGPATTAIVATWASRTTSLRRVRSRPSTWQQACSVIRPIRRSHLRYKKFNEDGTPLLDMDPGRYAQASAIGARAGGDGDSTFEDSCAPHAARALFGVRARQVRFHRLARRRSSSSPMRAARSAWAADHRSALDLLHPARQRVPAARRARRCSP